MNDLEKGWTDYAMSSKGGSRKGRKPMESISEWIEPEGVSIIDLQIHHCRWILDKRDSYGLVMYCGKQALEGSPYCYMHEWISRPHSKEE